LGQPETKVISDDWELEVALQQPKLCLTAEIEVETLTKAGIATPHLSFTFS